MKKILVYLFPSFFIWFMKTKVYTRFQFVGEYEKMTQRINKGVFIREKLKETREEIRREYDKVSEELDAITIAQERNSKLEDPDKTVKDKLEANAESKKKDIEQFKLQIDQLDKQMSEPGGIEDNIASYRAILPLIERLIKE